jgi:hypothetical protein
MDSFELVGCLIVQGEKNGGIFQAEYLWLWPENSWFVFVLAVLG